MSKNERIEKIGSVVAGLVLAAATITVGKEAEVGVDGAAHSKGMVVLRLSFPSRGEVSGVSVLFSRDGEVFENTRAGLPRNWQLFTSVGNDGKTATALVLLVGRFDRGRPSFLFDEPGTYYFRWGVAFEDNRAANFKIDQVVEVAPAFKADMAFLGRLADPGFLRHLFGRDLFDDTPETFRVWVHSDAGADYRALKVIARLLLATRATSVGDVFLGHKLPTEEDKRRWGGALLQLAEELPESSYAPYAAYYAGCCYSAIGLVRVGEGIRANRAPGRPKDRAAETKLRFSLTRKDPDCAKAVEAFALAAKRGDGYLKPRALFQQAVLRASAGALDEAEQVLSQAEQVVPGERTIQKMADKLRKRMLKLKQSRTEQEESNGRN